MPQVLNMRVKREWSELSNAVYVGRPTVYGNPFKVGSDGSREEVIRMYREWLNMPERAWLRALARNELRGKDLACWCAPLACHADVLLEGVNKT